MYVQYVCVYVWMDEWMDFEMQPPDIKLQSLHCALCAAASWYEEILAADNLTLQMLHHRVK